MVVRILLFLVFVWLAPIAQAATLSVAVAANFKPLLKQLQPQFEQQHSTRLSLSSASTGILYAQILHGAPFDVFLAADEKRPMLLEQQKRAVTGSRKTYAIGQLVLWHNKTQPSQNLLSNWSEKIAMANAKTAPYGLAAKSVLQHLNLWGRKRSQLVTGSNIAQTHQFLASGNVKLGFIALSQVKAQVNVENNYWLLPTKWYTPLNQQAVILKNSQKPDLAKTFLNWLLSAKIQQQIAKSGYAIPKNPP